MKLGILKLHLSPRRRMKKGGQSEAGKPAYFSESDETRSDFQEEADLLETLAGLDAELTLIDVPARNALVVIETREEATFRVNLSPRKEIALRLKSDIIGHIVSKSSAEPGVGDVSRD